MYQKILNIQIFQIEVNSENKTIIKKTAIYSRNKIRKIFFRQLHV